MTDDLEPLRQAMSDLSEHGGSTDMYERTLRKSRQSQRRAVVTTGVAAVVLAVGGTVAFAAVDRPHPSTPVAVQPPGPGCPSTETLQGLVELPAGWSFAASGVQCAEDWAAADVVRPAPDGSVRYLFHYTAGTGWRYHDQGSRWKCADLGLDEPAPFCSS